MYACIRGLFGTQQRSITARSMGRHVPLRRCTTEHHRCPMRHAAFILSASHLAPQLASTKSHGNEGRSLLHVHGDRVLLWFVIATPFSASRWTSNQGLVALPKFSLLVHYIAPPSCRRPRRGIPSSTVASDDARQNHWESVSPINSGHASPGPGRLSFFCATPGNGISCSAMRLPNCVYPQVTKEVTESSSKNLPNMAARRLATSPNTSRQSLVLRAPEAHHIIRCHYGRNQRATTQRTCYPARDIDLTLQPIAFPSPINELLALRSMIVLTLIWCLKFGCICQPSGISHSSTTRT